MESPAHAGSDFAGKFIEFAKTGDDALRTELIEGHMWLPHHLARRFAHRGETLDDLVQVGSMALVKAVDRFDPERAVAFSTYATHTIVGEIKRHFRDKGWAVRAPRRIQELYLEINRSVATMSQSLGRSPTIAELAESLDVSEESVLEAQEAGNAYDFSSIDAPVPHDGDSVASRIGAVDPEFSAVDSRSVLADLISVLPQRERALLHLRFVEGLTQSEIAKQMGLSQMHISRLLAQSLVTMRSVAKEHH